MNIKPLRIGNLTIDFPVILAPMAGYTDSSFRSICKDFHCGMFYTEVINAEAIVRGSKATILMLDVADNEGPIAAHIYGSKPEVMAEAAAIMETMNRFVSIDVNCGCPVRKIVAKGAGADLMHHPEKISAIISAIRSAVKLPVTIKTRIGPSPKNMNISEVAHAAEEAGASAIAIHARFTSKKHSGPADWEALAKVKAERTIPVIGNGGVKSAQDVFEMISQTGVDGVMVGRGAVGNPWLFEEAYLIAHDLTPREHGKTEHKAIIVEHLNRLIELKGKAPKYRRRRTLSADQGAAMHFRAHLFRYLSGCRDWNKIKQNLNQMNTPEAILEAVNSVLK